LFFVKFFQEKQKENKKAMKRVEQVSDIELDLNEEEDEEEVWNALAGSKGFDAQMLDQDEDEIPDGLDELSDISSLADDSTGECELDSNGDMETWAGFSQEAEQPLEDLPKDEDFDKDSDMFSFSDEGSHNSATSDAVAHVQNVVTSKTKKTLNRIAERASRLGYRGSYFDSNLNSGDFAAMEEFSALMDQDSISDDVVLPVRKRSKSSLPREAKKSRK
jgi:hypothetical protein